MAIRAHAFAGFLAALCLGGAAAHAQTPVVQPRAVLELFTSQGCSSCPAADALFVELARNPGVIALTMPVTYWDYLGWKDTLGQDIFTKRQKHYAKGRGDGQVYTPQAVVNGAAHLVGSDKAGLDRVLRQQAAGALPVRVTLQEEAGALRIQLAAAAAGSEKPAGIWVLPISRMVTVPIGRGENQGRTVSYANVVRGMVRVGDWTGAATTVAAPLSATQAPEADSYVVLLQADQASRSGLILGAARGR